jgi:hypothetical protein
MNLSDLIHAPTRPSWTVRLLAYIALVLTITLAVQIIQVLLW